MRPTNCPAYAWLHAAECAVLNGHGIKNFWGWSRRERTKVLLAALDALTSNSSAMDSAVQVEDYQECWEAAYAAAHEVMVDRRRRKRRQNEQR